MDRRNLGRGWKTFERMGNKKCSYIPQ
ncbi:Bgt-50569 [Blumeria graminis f. sp. tritici]|uniref:Bgt-50569 n=1 Tax=Blumeria graminis f. sp. tritici TaxID=62690 RepID=A0A9X9MGR5_BLUGR|nr:Bgt-50569 [Blumeria graminis f. sp. tritici]